MSFNCIPPEIYAYIFSSLCQSEGGCYTTAANLCALSRHFYHLTTPLLYRTIYIPDTRSASRLARTFKNNTSLTQLARHLLLADSDLDDQSSIMTLPDFAFSWPTSNIGRIERRMRLQKWLDEREKILASFADDVRIIIDGTASGLRNLALLRFARCERDKGGDLILDVLARRFPKLVELTLRSSKLDVPSSLHMPSLKRLHLAGGEFPSPVGLFKVVLRSCRALTHIRITEPVTSVPLAMIIETALGINVGMGNRRQGHNVIVGQGQLGTDYGQMLEFPRAFECLIVQPGPIERSPEGVVTPRYMEMMERLEKASRGQLKLVIVPPLNKHDIPYRLETAKGHWLGRIRGGAGCWKRGL